MECSIFKSAVSLDQSNIQSQDRSTYDRNEYQEAEINRLHRKISLLEKSKYILEEELLLYKEEITSKNQKIAQLEQQNKHKSQATLQSFDALTQYSRHSSFEVILCEKEEQINLISESLSELKKKFDVLSEQNLRLQQEISSKTLIINHLKETEKTIEEHHRSQLSQLEYQLCQKSKEITSVKVFYQNLAHKQILKWQKYAENLKQKIQFLEKKHKQSINEYFQSQKQFERLKLENESLFDEIQGLKQSIEWYKSVLQQAKGQFIDAQLKQQQLLQRQQKEKLQYKKRNHLLKTQLKSLKSDSTNTKSNSNGLSCKSVRAASFISITPFRPSNTSTRNSNFSDYQ